MGEAAKKATLQDLQELIKKSEESRIEGEKALRESLREVHLAQQRGERSMEEVRQAQKKTELAQQKTELAQQRTEKSLRESEQRIQKRMAKLDELFTGQWGKLMESLVEGDLIGLLNERKIKVRTLAKETESVWEGKEYQFDIIATNGAQIVVVEVKTTLRLKDIDHFIKKLRAFKDVFPAYSKKEIFGAVAYLKANEASDKNAQKKGLFVIRATGNSASITNAANFKPTDFS